jgi:BirA family biotin operon repressor/biotin-[acetyl-CoA-carboxylase] ligase
MFTCVLSDAAKRALAGTRFADVRWVSETGSTNADVMALARAGVGEGLAIVADHQTAGRGRVGRTWSAPSGSSLLLSVLLRPTPAAAGFCGMAMGVAAVDAVSAVTGVTARLKWPNDLVWPGLGDRSDRKVGGILAEADWSDAASPAVVVGIGLNVNWPPSFPEDLRAIATSLNHVASRDVDREELLVAILRELDRRCDDGGLVDAVRARSATLGSRVRVELAAEVFDGDAAELTDQGHLVVVVDGGAQRVISAGDVVHLRPA